MDEGSMLPCVAGRRTQRRAEFRGAESAQGKGVTMGRLQDRVALVFGAGSSGPGWGNGKATAVTFAREGAA